MDSRGQASAEYIFLILIFLIVLTTVTVPFAGNAISSSQNVSVTSDAQTALSSIVNAVNVVYANGPGAKRTLSLYFPQGSNLGYSSNVLSLNLQGVGYSNGSSKSNVNATVPYPITVSGGTVTKGWHKVSVSWGVGNSSITVTVAS